MQSKIKTQRQNCQMSTFCSTREYPSTSRDARNGTARHTQDKCEVMGDPNKSKVFDSPRMQASNSPSCKANKPQQIKADNADANDANSNMPESFRSRINSTIDKTASQVLMSIMHNKFSDFLRNWMF